MGNFVWNSALAGCMPCSTCIAFVGYFTEEPFHRIGTYHQVPLQSISVMRYCMLDIVSMFHNKTLFICFIGQVAYLQWTHNGAEKRQSTCHIDCKCWTSHALNNNTVKVIFWSAVLQMQLWISSSSHALVFKCRVVKDPLSLDFSPSYSCKNCKSEVINCNSIKQCFTNTSANLMQVQLCCLSIYINYLTLYLWKRTAKLRNPANEVVLQPLHKLHWFCIVLCWSWYGRWWWWL